MTIKKGINRIVFVFKTFVIKIPRHYSHYHFLQGCYANWAERNFCKENKNNFEKLYRVTPSIYCSIFGLCQIQLRATQPLKYALNKRQKEKFRLICGGDYKKSNFGYYRGQIVCVDYGHVRKLI